MDGLAELRQVSNRDGVKGRIAEALEEAVRLIGDTAHELEAELVAAYRAAPGEARDAVHHMISAGGKRLRPLVCLLSHQAVCPTDTPPLDMAVVCELLHNATLLHDDVIDEGDLRRGEPAARVVYGNAISVLGGDYLLIQAVDMVSRHGPALMAPFVVTLHQLITGELVQLRLRGSVEATEEDYFSIIEGKTASLFRFAAEAGALTAGGDASVVRALGDFGLHVGVAFQLMDDSLDFAADPDKLGKSLLADINEGKLTLPVILAAQRSAEARELLGRFGAHGENQDIAREIARIVADEMTLVEVRNRAAQRTDEAIAALEGVSGLDPRIVSLLGEIARGLLDREL